MSSDYHQSARSVAEHSFIDVPLIDNYRARQRGTRAARQAGPIDESVPPAPPTRGEERLRREWVDGVVRLAGMLVDCGLGDVEMFIEYELYHEPGAKELGPVDVVLAGTHPERGEFSYVLVELKRWSYARKVAGDPLKVECGYEKPKPHPAVQVDGYRINMLKHFDIFANSYVSLTGLAYLPNLTRHGDQWVTEYSPTRHARAMTGMDPDTFKQELLKHLSPTNGSKASEALLNSPVNGSRPLEDEFGALLRGTLKYNLVDTQLEAYNEIAEKLRNSSSVTKDVFLIQGGAGTGKSVLAAELVKLAVKENLEWAFVSGGRSSRETFKRDTRPHGRRFIPLSRLANKHGADSLALVICDEAQAMPDFPILNSARAKRMDETSVQVVLSRGRVAVFLVDGDQRVRPDEVWPPQAIVEAVREIPGVRLIPRKLSIPLRGASSRTYQTWVDRLLGAHRPDPLVYDIEDAFQVHVANSPGEMERFLRAKLDNEKLTARIAAGYAWNWSKVEKGAALPNDVRIDGWHRPWNAPDDYRSATVPPGLFWATGDGGFDQIGCIYTSRGLEYHWGGVIFGADLVWRDGSWLADPDASFDRHAKGAETDAEYERQIRNAYQTMLKRSMAGTVVFSADEETQQLFKRLLPPLPE